MQIGRVSFRGDVVDFSKARNNRQKQAPQTKTQTNQDTFTKSATAANTAVQATPQESSTQRTITEDNPIYYTRIFDRINKLLTINSKEYRITPEDAAKEVIQILKEGTAIKALYAAYDKKQYKEVGSFLNAFEALDMELDDSKLSENTYIAIKSLSAPIHSIADEIDSQAIMIPDEDEELFEDKVGYFILENMVRIEAEGTEEEKADHWETIENVIKEAHQTDEFPTFTFSVPSTPGLNPEIWTRTMSKFFEIVSKVRQEYPCNPENYIPEEPPEQEE